MMEKLVTVTAVILFVCSCAPTSDDDDSGILVEITEVIPSSGPIGGGQAAVVHGFGFLDVTDTVRVQFGAELATVQEITPTQVTVLTPAGASEGLVSVTVENQWGLDTLANGYYYGELYNLSGGTYDVSNHTVAQDQCDIAGVPSQLPMAVPGANGSDADLDGIELERVGNKLTGFDEVQDFDLNPSFDCVADETYTYDAAIIADDQIAFTVTTFWERDPSFGGSNAECATAYGVAFFPCQTVESFEMSLAP